MWRPYVVANFYGKKQVMRDTEFYPSRERAIRAIKEKNNKWMKLNYGSGYVKNSRFQYGAYQVSKQGKDAYKAGQVGNDQLLNDVMRNDKSQMRNVSKSWLGM